MSAFPQKFHIYLPKFLMTFFSHRPFFVFYMVFFHLGAKSVADIAMGGGQNSYFSTKSQYYHCSFCPRGGRNSIANGRICPPWIRHCTQMMIYTWSDFLYRGYRFCYD